MENWTIGSILEVGAYILIASGTITGLAKLYDKWRVGLRKPNKEDIEKLTFELKSFNDNYKTESAELRLDVKVLKEATAAIYREQIEGTFNYYMEQGAITAHQRAALILKIENYSNLGFNHLKKKTMIEDLKHLPLIYGNEKKERI